jgi:hypothetical protein
MARILVVNSPLFEETNNFSDEDSLPPIGLGIIATSLKENFHDIVELLLCLKTRG